MSKFRNLTGKKFGHWDVEGFSNLDARKNAKFMCRCDMCGDKYNVYGLNLLAGKSSKCKKCAAIERTRKHARII